MICQHGRCSREATMGSRCGLHWFRRTKAGQRLNKYKWWKKTFEKRFAQGLDARRMTGYTGPVEWTFPPRYQEKWMKLIGEILAAFDKGVQRGHSNGGEEARGELAGGDGAGHDPAGRPDRPLLGECDW